MNDVLTNHDVSAIIKRLWSPLADGSKPNVFMVIDCARDKRIEPLINNANIEQSCLYAGNLTYKLKRAAPHIVKLTESSPFTAKILTLGFGKNWGIFFVAKNTTTMAKVRSNCRRLAKVKGVTGKNLVFRYYDPRVTRLMLPVCNQHELDCILGESISLLIETGDEQEHRLGFTIYQRGDVTNPVSVKTLDINENTQSIDQDRLNGPGKNPAHSWQGFFKLRQAHMDAIQNKLNDAEFLEIKKNYIEYYLKSDENTLENEAQTEVNISDLSFEIEAKAVDINTFLRLCFNKAKGFNLKSHYSILSFIQMNQQYGWLFWKKQQYTWVEGILLSDRPCEAKIETITKKLSRILMEQMWS